MFDDSPFCDCGVTLHYGEDQCPVCAGAPHHRECPCDECEAYWHEVAERSERAAEEFNRQLVCSCGWTGAYAEDHREKSAGCTIGLRAERAA